MSCAVGQICLTIFTQHIAIGTRDLFLAPATSQNWSACHMSDDATSLLIIECGLISACFLYETKFKPDYFHMLVSSDPGGGGTRFHLLRSSSTESSKCLSKYMFINKEPWIPFLTAHGKYVVANSTPSLEHIIM